MTIDQFRKSSGYYWLSNFQPSPVEYCHVVYPTVEHAYQAAKTRVKKERQSILNASTPGQARRLGQTVTLRHDWDDVKISVMKHLVRQKFFNDESLAEKLLKTGENHLVENSTGWNDRFWGVADGVGLNHLGRILMDVREELKARRNVGT